MSETWILLGATSAMARALARALAARGAGLLLAGRDSAELAAIAADCRLRGARMAEAVAWDARDATSIAPLIGRAAQEEGTLCCAVFAGSMPAQAEIDADPALVDGTVADSYLGPARFLQTLAPLIEQRGAGSVVGVGSVAGDRGRLGNYVYGSAKAGFHTYLSGLRNRLGRSGAHVVTVKPGFVDTAMTFGKPGLFLVAAPGAVARAALAAAEKGREEIYAPFFWRYIMLIIKSIPERVMKKLDI